MRQSRFRLITLMLSLMLFVTGCATAEQVSPSPTAEPESTAASGTKETGPVATPWPTNDKGMPFLLYDYKESPMTFTDLTGKVIYLNFFTTWCYYCKVEMPELFKLHQAYGDNLQVVLVHVPSNDTEEAAVAYLKENGYDSMRMVEDKDMFLTSFYQLEGFPLSVIIDKDGYLALYQPGAMTYEQMVEAVTAAGAEPAAAE